MPEFIAQYEVFGRREPSGPRFQVRVLILKPVQSVDTPTAWACTVSVDPLWSNPFEIFGEGSFQALCLGAKHAVQMLATFVQQGGVLEHADGEPVELSNFGFMLLPAEGAQE